PHLDPRSLDVSHFHLDRNAALQLRWGPNGEPMLTDNYANVNGVRLHYVTNGTGPLILFLHGFPEFWYAWKNQLSEFGKDRHAVALDMRGFNLSDKPAEIARYRLDVL